MLLQKIIKRTINNCDYFKLRNSEIKKCETYRNILPFSNNNMKMQNNISFNIKKNNLGENTNYLPNNISSNNCFGKYKDKILNRVNIVEPNHQTINKYLNIKSSSFRAPMRNHKFNNISNNFKTVGNRIYRVDSEDNIFHNKFYLSQKLNQDENEEDNNQNQNNNVNYFPNRFYDKRKSDITDNSIIEISNNKQSYFDYYKKRIEFRDINRQISEQNKNDREKKLFASRLKEYDNINRENNYFSSIEAQDLIEKRNMKFLYKSSLDEQVKNNLSDKLKKESLSFNDLIQNTKYLPKIKKPKLIEINPYKHRNYFLGNSQLKHNIITNPLSFIKINKYFFPKNDVGEINY